MVVSHERSGTHLTIDTIRRQFKACQIPLKPFEHPHHLYVSIDKFFPGRKSSATVEEVAAGLARTSKPIIKTHDFPDWRGMQDDKRDYVRELQEASTLLYCVRNPYSVFCSYWSWMRSWNAAGVGDLASFIREPRNGFDSRAAYWAAHVRAWIDLPGVMVLSFRHTRGATSDMLKRVGTHIGETPLMKPPLLPRPVRGRVSKLMDRVTGRYESTNLGGKGLPSPKPKQAYTPEDIQFIYDAAPDLFERFGWDVLGAERHEAEIVTRPVGLGHAVCRPDDLASSRTERVQGGPTRAQTMD